MEGFRVKSLHSETNTKRGVYVQSSGKHALSVKIEKNTPYAVIGS